MSFRITCHHAGGGGGGGGPQASETDLGRSGLGPISVQVITWDGASAASTVDRHIFAGKCGRHSKLKYYRKLHVPL